MKQPYMPGDLIRTTLPTPARDQRRTAFFVGGFGQARKARTVTNTQLPAGVVAIVIAQVATKHGPPDILLWESKVGMVWVSGGSPSLEEVES